MKRYCMSCGSPTDYSTKKPIYCSNCGESFDKLENKHSIASIKTEIKDTIKPKLSKFRIRPNIDNNIEDYHDIDDEQDIDYVPNIKNLEVETFVEEVHKENLGEILRKKPESKEKPSKNRKKRKTR